MEISEALNSVGCYCMESWFVQTELVIQEFQMATWAKKVIVTIPNLDGSVIFKVDETSPQQALFVMCSLSMCWYSFKNNLN